MSQRTLVVSSYPPRRCGIGAYASAHVRRLRADGDDVTVLSPPDGEGDIRVSFDSGAPFVRARSVGAGYDRILVHFQPTLYYRPRAALSKILTSLRLLSLVGRRKQTEILVHEADQPALWRPDYFLLRRAFSRATLLFHTEAERRQLERGYRIRARARLVPHAEGIDVRTISRPEARAKVDLPPDEPLFVCAGFMQPSKGFERAIEAWNRAGMPGRLAIVGSVRETTATNVEYRRMLEKLCEGVDRLVLVDRYLSAEDFDAWIAAADLLLLPYRRSFSSGVLARAQRLGTPAAVAESGGLTEQAGPADIVFRTDDELTGILAGAVAVRG